VLVTCEGVALLQLGTPGGMALAMADAEVLAHKGAVTVGEITVKDLFG